MKNKTLILASVGFFEMYYLKYPLNLCLLYFNGIIILGTIYKLFSLRKARLESVKLPVQTPEAKDEFQIKFERKLLDLYTKTQAEKQNKVLKDDSSSEFTLVGTMKDIPRDTSIKNELAELTSLHDQIRIMNQKLKTAK
jgi:hypothetical protein